MYVRYRLHYWTQYKRCYEPTCTYTYQRCILTCTQSVTWISPSSSFTPPNYNPTSPLPHQRKHTPSLLDSLDSFIKGHMTWLPPHVIHPMCHVTPTLVSSPDPTLEEGKGSGEFGHNPWGRERNLSTPMRLQL